MALSSFLRDASGQSSSMLRNVLQGMGATQATPVEDVVVTASRPQALQAPIEGPSASALPALVAPPRREPPRRSMLQRFGGLADALALAGDAKPLYQPTLDARQQRADAATAQDRERLGMVMKGYQAAITNGMPEAQARSLIPQLMQSVNMSPEAIEANIATINSSPEALQGMLGLSGALREPAKHGMNVQYATGPDGQVMAYTVNDQGGISRLEMPEGFSPTLPLQAVNAGGQTIMANRLNAAPTGDPIQHSVRPDTEANNNARAAQGEANREYWRGRDAQASADRRYAVDNRSTGSNGGKAAPNPIGLVTAAMPIIQDLESAAGRLYQSGGMRGEDTSALGALGVDVRRRVPLIENMLTPEGASARADLDRLTTTGITALLPLMGGLTVGGRNMDAAKELQTWKAAVLSSEDYPSAVRAVRSLKDRANEVVRGSDQFKNGEIGLPDWENGGFLPPERPAARPSASNTGGSAVGRTSRRIDVDAPSRPAAQQSAPRVVNW